MWHLSTPNENATFCSLLNGIICIYSTGYGNGKNQAKTSSLLYDTRANCKFIKNIPSQYFACYIKSWNWIVLRWLIFLNNKLKRKSFQWHSHSSVKETLLRLQLWAQHLSDWICQSPKGPGLFLVSLGLLTAASQVCSTQIHHLHKQMYTKHFK